MGLSERTLTGVVWVQALICEFARHGDGAASVELLTRARDAGSCSARHVPARLRASMPRAPVGERLRCYGMIGGAARVDRLWFRSALRAGLATGDVAVRATAHALIRSGTCACAGDGCWPVGIS